MAPYLVGWTLYQGSTLMSVVNWTGLVVNGFVAFLLPMYLVIKSMERRHLDVLVSHEDEAQEDRTLLEMSHTRAARSTGTSINSDLADNVGSLQYSTFENAEGGRAVREGGSVGSITPSSLSGNNTAAPSPMPVHEHPIHDDSCVEPLPLWLEPYRYPIVLFMIVCFAVIIGGTITLDVVMGIQPSR